MTVICIAGVPGSGKTTLARVLADHTGARCGSFGDYVRACARERGLGTDRASLQRLGQDLVDEGPQRFCNRTLNWLGWNPPEELILEGLRHTSVHDALKAIVHPIRVCLVFIDIDRRLQRERLLARNDDVAERLLADPSERDLSALRSRADLRVVGTQTPDSSVSAITSWIGENS